MKTIAIAILALAFATPTFAFDSPEFLAAHPGYAAQIASTQSLASPGGKVYDCGSYSQDTNAAAPCYSGN